MKMTVIKGGKKKTYKNHKKNKHVNNISKTIKKKHVNSKNKKSKTKRKNQGKKMNIYFPKLKGGMSSISTPPHVPPGGGLDVSAPTHGGKYYNLAKYGGNTPGYLYTQHPRNNIPTPEQQSGGSMVPQDIVDLYRSAVSNITGGVNTIQAKPTPNSVLDPLPYQQPALYNSNELVFEPSDVNGILTDAFNQASKV